MKITTLMAVFLILVLGLGGACNSEGEKGPDTKEPAKTKANKDLTTFAEWDQMTTKKQGKLLVNRARKLYYYLEKNDPAKAQCMKDRFLGKVGETTEGFEDFVKKAKGVPDKKRANNYVENLMAGYIIHDLCRDVT